MHISGSGRLMLCGNRLTPRQRWMFYPIYAVAALVLPGTTLFLVTLNETREFIGERGVEYCQEN